MGGRDQVGAVERRATRVRLGRRVARELLELDRGLALVASPLAHAEQRGDRVEEAARARGEGRVHLQASRTSGQRSNGHGPARPSR